VTFQNVTTIYGMAGREKRTMEAAFTVCGNADTVEEVRCLIAAAPELLAVCRAAEQWAMLTQTDSVPWLDAASNAITKAAGQER
jgi:hypothetical protein